MSRSQLTLWLAMIILLCIAVPVVAQDSPFPAPTGPYAVGTTSRYWMDESRDEPYTPKDKNDRRELIVDFWYPADVPPDAAPAPYLSNAVDELKGVEATFAAVGSTVHFSVETLNKWLSHSLANAPITSAQAHYPVLIFSHGSGGLPRLHTSQLEELASQGYIVAAINHTYGSATTVLPDGRVIHANFGIPEEKVAAIWSDDQIYVLNQLEKLNADDPEGMFTGKFDLDTVGILGQSMGGAVSIKTCLNDVRCKAVLSEDGFATLDVAQKGLATPFMLMRNESGTTSEDVGLFKISTAPIYALTMDGFGHVNFSDAPLWGENIPLISSVDPLRAIQVTHAYTLAFFNHFLKGSDEPLLDGASAEYPEADLQVFNN